MEDDRSYVLANALSAMELQKHVRYLITLGYVPSGGVAIEIRNNMAMAFYQAMIHRDVHAATLNHNVESMKKSSS